MGERAEKLRRGICFAQNTEVKITVALGEPPSVRRGEQGDVIVFRRCGVEQTVEIQLPRRGREKIAPAHDLRYTGVDIIRHDGELIGENAVRAPENEVPALAREIFGVWAVMPVRKGDALVRHTQPPERGAHFRFRRALFFGKIAAGAGVDRVTVGGVRSVRGVFEIAARTPAGIDKALAAQPVENALIVFAARALIRLLSVPRETEPAQIVF